MKKILNTYITIVLLSFVALGATAQQADTIRVIKNDLRKRGNELVIDATIYVPGKDVVKSRNVIELTPVVETENQKMGLPPVLLNGKIRNKLYKRMDALNNLDEEVKPYVVVNVADADDSFTVDYRMNVPWEPWMTTAKVVLARDLCGCGKEEPGDPLLIGTIMQRPDRRYVPVPVFAYVTPDVETRKERAEVGTAYIEFQVNRFDIQPNRANNATELSKIRSSIEKVIHDEYITPDGIELKGYASPEGSYRNNAYLAENRTKSLGNYIMSQYRQFSRNFFSFDSEPEDWAGFRKCVEDDPNVPSRAAVFDIIDSHDEADVKERKLRALDGGTPFRYVLAEFFPGLRRTEYKINYTVRGFSLQEGREIIKTRPQHLSLNEMFAVANSYQPGSNDYNEVFEIAVRMYPADPVANLNAANIAINKQDYAAARRYLASAGNSAQADLSRGILAMMEGNLDEAERLLKSAQNGGVQQAAANLEQLAKKRADNALFDTFE